MKKWIALALITALLAGLCCLAAAEDLPEPIRSNYNRQRNSKVMLREI